MPNIIRFGGNVKKVEVVQSLGLIRRFKVFTYDRGKTTTIDLSDWDLTNVICKQNYDIPYSYQESFSLNRTTKILTINNTQSTSSTKNSFVLVEWNCIKWQVVGRYFTGPDATETIAATPEATKRIILLTQSSETNGYTTTISSDKVLATIRGGITIHDPNNTKITYHNGYYGEDSGFGIVLDL